MRHAIAASFCFLALGAVACSATDEVETGLDDVDNLEQGAHDSTYTYYVGRPDFRKCAWPMCGGFFVHRVNRAKTQCADGTWQDECYVAQIDYSAVGLNSIQVSEANARMGGGTAIVRGDMGIIESDFGQIGTLMATEAWRGEAAQTEPTGTFYRVDDSGIVCFTWPCPSLLESKLNSSVTKLIHDLDLYASGAPTDRVDAGYAALWDDAVLVVGNHETFKGPAGKGKALVASQFYTRIVAEPEEVKCGSSICGAGEYCCNESCGICAPEGGFCTYQLCEPTEGECTTNADCRTFSSYCGGCQCLSLSAFAPDPICDTEPVTCFADPCMDQQPVCAAGVCTTVIP
jgi:hypothetical protein